MTRKFRCLMALSMGFGIIANSNVGAKPPDLPAVPTTEFKVLSAASQEYHESDEADVPSVFVPDVSWTAGSLAASAIGGSWTRVVWTGDAKPATWSLKIYVGFPQAFGQFFGPGWKAGVVVVSEKTINKDRLARDVFDMAEAHRLAGDLEEAKHWYAGVKKLYPRSTYAKQAEERLERFTLLRIAAEAAEEQSEEPPIAGPERLTVLPREVTP